MKSEYQIYCDYKKAMNLADRIERYAKKIASIVGTELKDEIFALEHNAWESEAINIIKYKYTEVNDGFQADYKDFIKIADTIRNIAIKNYRAEKKALEIAQKRKYKN